jgi:transcriptional regulator with XRE-family HTH domain
MNRIKEILKEKGMSQKELAEKLGMSDVGVSKIVNGSTTKDTMKKIAEILGVETEVLYAKGTIVKYSGELNLSGIKIPCYVLDDGTRVISGRGVQEALKMVDIEDGKQTAGTRLARYLNQKTLNPYISKYLESDHFQPIICTNSGKTIHGYKADVLADICDAFLEARRNISLSPRQEIIAAQCEILMRAFARVGIIALVDEATGFDKIKEDVKDKLQTFLDQFLMKEAAKWVKTFPDEFFMDIYKMRNWDWQNTRRMPGVMGNWIRDIVYERIAPILPELDKLNPKNEHGHRSKRFHQFLSREEGLPKLKEYFASIHTIVIMSDYNWEKFWANLDKVHPRTNTELFLAFED